MNTEYMRFHMRGALLCFAVLAVCVRSSTQAATIFNNFGPGDTFSDSGRVLEGPDVGSIGDVNQAASFAVGPSSVLLGSVSLGIFITDSPTVGTGPLDVIVAGDAAGSPGAVLRTLPINVNATGKQVITVVDDGTFLLDANTNYWIIADAEDSFRGSWNFNSIGDVGLTAGQSEGNPWNLRPDDDRYALRVEAQIIPEPSTLAGAVIVLLVFGFRPYSRLT